MNEGLNDWINTTWILSAHSRAERRDCETTFITSFSPSPVRFEFTERSSLHKSVVNVSFQHEESPVHTIRKNNNLSTERHREKLVDRESLQNNYWTVTPTKSATNRNKTQTMWLKEAHTLEELLCFCIISFITERHVPDVRPRWLTVGRLITRNLPTE